MQNYVDIIFRKNVLNFNKCAIVDQNGKRNTTWNELYLSSCKIAILARNRKLSGIVPVCMPRSTETVITLLGLGLAGLGVAPLSDNTPQSRISLIEEQTENKTWTISDFNEAISNQKTAFSSIEFNEDTPAYVVYTSGSTGIPKGVMLSNETVIKSYKRMASKEFLDLCDTDIVLQSASFSFVALMIDLFAPLYSGCLCHILPEEARMDIELMTQYISSHNITSMFITPKPLKRLGDTSSLRVVCVGGEKVTELGPKNYRLLNVWGMSETAALALGYNITEPMTKTPIGESAGDFKTYIVDDNGNISDEGELCLSGAIASGYFKRPDLTQKTFISNPFSNEKGFEKLMHTGDIVRRLPDGNILYLNRKDFMIKINGQRVEPGEAESALEQLEGISSVAVKGFIESDGHSYLCAYYVSDKTFSDDDLRNELNKHLPSYMIPSFFIKLDSLPLNANGKLDRNSLPAPSAELLLTKYEQATSPIEETLCKAFENVLNLDRVGINDDFIKLGGDSIRAMSVVSFANINGLYGPDILIGRTPKAIAEKLNDNINNITISVSNNLTRTLLTDSQMGIYLECIEQPQSTMYNIPLHLSFKRGSFTSEQIKNAVDKVISLHPALYSYTETIDDKVYMVRSSVPQNGICEVFLSNDDEINSLLDNCSLPFDLACAPLCRAKALLTEEKVHIFMDIHHIVSDGTSISILTKQICDCLAGKELSAEQLDSFSVYDLEKNYVSEKEIAKQYFSNLLSGVETDSNLLFDKKTTINQNKPSKRSIYKIDKLDLSHLRENGITENSLFMGVYGYVLAKITGQTSSLFTVGESGRKSPLLSNTVSMFVHTLPVYIDIDEHKSAFDILNAVQTQFLSSVANDSYSFGDIAREFGINSDVTFVYQSDMLSDFESEIGHIDLNILETGEAYANLSTSVLKTEDGYLLNIKFRNDCYSQITIDRLATLFSTVAKAFSQNKYLFEIKLIDNNDLLFLDNLNHTENAYDENKTIIDIFREVATENPDKYLVISEDNKYTYSEANRITDCIATYIHSLGIGKNSTVSVLIPRCEYIVLASLGIMKAGAIYQPLDPSYPSERLSFMTKDANTQLLIADRSLVELLPDYIGPILFTDEIPSLTEINIDFEPPKPNDGFILLYTSGTTGKPKGCLLIHSNLISFVHAFSNLTQMDNSMKAAAYSSYGFDAHMCDIYPTILNSGEIHIIQENIRLDLPALKDYCESNGITHMVMTTQLAHQFTTEYPIVKGLRCLLTGGEKLVSFEPNGNYRFINAYGPTECTIMGTYFHVDKFYEDIPIGKAIDNIKLYVVDSFGRRLPVGAPGELIMCGPQVASNYLNREEKTKEVFVKNTYEENPGKLFERCYKTGDIVRFQNDGNLAFIGRRDMQVKIRGFRIELSEVERIIRQYPGITDATVVARDAISGGKCLHAYIVSKETISIEDLNKYIKENKPPYMVPSATMQIDRIPLNVNGKVDKKKLPEPKVHFEDMTKPENELQQRIFDKVSDVVGTDSFGINTDLYLVGLSSISSIKLCSVLAKEFDIAVQIRNIKKHNTIAKLETFITQTLNKKNNVNTSIESTNTDNVITYLPSHPISKTMEGIFVECIRKPESTFYNIPYLIKISPKIDIDKLKIAIVKAIDAHPYINTELFTDNDGKICQHRQSNKSFSISDIDEIKTNNINDILDNLLTPFTITNSRLFKISIIFAEEVYLFFNIHHIIADGTSINILIRDIESAYSDNTIIQETYDGYCVADDEKESRDSETLKDAEEYYSALLNGLDKDFLPIPDVRNNISESSGRIIMHQELANADQIIEFCTKNKISINSFFVSAFGLVLSRYASTEYSVFNTIYNGRNDSRTENSFAMLVKTMPIVCYTDKDSVLELISSVSNQLMDSMAYDIYSFAEISKNFGVNNDIIFIFQGDSFTRNSFCHEPSTEIPISPSEAKATIAMQVLIQNEKLVFDFEYDSSKFSEKLAKAFVCAYDAACASFITNEKLTNVSLLSSKAIEEMEVYNNNTYEYDKNETITSLFLENAKKYPNQLCISYKNIQYSYSEVEELTGKIALFLINKNIGKDDVVSILINRNENMVITAHGVVRTGAAYIGLDPTYPTDRLEFMIKDSGSKYLIAERELLDIIPNYSGNVLFVDEIKNLPSLLKEEESKYLQEEKHQITPENKALIIYSSGTTGIPKGSILQHKSIVCYYHNYRRLMNLDNTSRIATYASFGFDGGAQDVFCSPMVGASLFVIPDEIRLEISSLDTFYIDNQITHGFMTTQVGSMFISSTRCCTLKTFVVGGEKLIPTIAPEGVCFYNAYGPSETFCFVNKYLVHDTKKLQPIGTVNDNTKEYIIDKFGNRLPFGACGELCISGGQMGLGYLNRPEKTATSFVNNPFSNQEGYEKMYRTGDIVRMLPDGNYDFVGRRDGQVKIRGFRIELSEIEQQIRKYSNVQNVVVLAYDNPSGGKYLAAYVVIDAELDVNDIKSFISAEKPDYMVPTVIMKVDEIPLTSNGKIAVGKLPKPELGSLKKGAEPKDETEERICNIFEEVLGVDKVYADDDFFNIGGSSISAIQVIVKCEQAGLQIVYKNLFTNPTAQKLSEFLNGVQNNDINAEDLEKKDQHDYSALKYNIIENLPNIKNIGIGTVLLTGATGFLGSHILYELLTSTESSVICIVRGRTDIPAQMRLEMMLIYYFEDWDISSYWDRITVIEGDLENEKTKEQLTTIDFDTIINCAANVKHFAAGDELLNANYSGVENLINLVEEKNAKLIQISSLSVCGESVNGSISSDFIFRETDLNIGQSLENKYIYTKYLAEQAVIDAISKKRIKGKIVRLGNLMARIEDSQFQVNAGTNGFLRLFIGFGKLGCFPISMMDSPIEFSPIDSVAKAVVLLSGTPEEFTVFHAKNCNSIHFGYFLNAIKKAGKEIELVEDSVFTNRLNKALEDDANVEELGGLLAYRNDTSDSINEVATNNNTKTSKSKLRLKIASDTTFTTKALYRLGFAWPLIDNLYLEKMVEILTEMNFFTDNN